MSLNYSKHSDWHSGWNLIHDQPPMYYNKYFFNSDRNICRIEEVTLDEVFWRQLNTNVTYDRSHSAFAALVRKGTYKFADEMERLLYG